MPKALAPSRSSRVTRSKPQSALQALAPRSATRTLELGPIRETRGIHTDWLVRLRWGALLGQLITVLAVNFGLRIKLPLGALCVVLSIEAASNVVFARGARRTLSSTLSDSTLLALPMALDVVLLTALLFLTGGPFNPFSFLYLVHIALAAVVLSARLTWGLVALSLAGFGMLFLGEHWLPSAFFRQLDHLDQMRVHMQGMWFAFAAAAVFITYFVTSLRHSLAQRELELVRARSLASQSEKLASLATLATGAAHELSTPLSTIAVVAKELERALSRPQAATLTQKASALNAELQAAAQSESAQADARLIRREVERCREILQRMAADAGHVPEPDDSPISVAELLNSAVQGIPRADGVRITLDADAQNYTLQSQAQAVTQALRGVLKNALQASPLDKPVEIAAMLADAGCRIEVRDHGTGMSEEVLARAGEPFFTTKEPGEGMGLGLFLARVVVDRMNGQFNLHSTQGEGTVVTLSLPVTAPATTHRTPLRN